MCRRHRSPSRPLKARHSTTALHSSLLSPLSGPPNEPSESLPKVLCRQHGCPCRVVKFEPGRRAQQPDFCLGHARPRDADAVMQCLPSQKGDRHAMPDWPCDCRAGEQAPAGRHEAFLQLPARVSTDEPSDASFLCCAGGRRPAVRSPGKTAPKGKHTGAFVQLPVPQQTSPLTVPLFYAGSRCPPVRCSGEEVPAGRHRGLCAAAGGGPSRRAHRVGHEACSQGAAQQPPQKRGPAGTQPVSLGLHVTRTQAGPALCLWRCCLLCVLVPAAAGSAACSSCRSRHLPLSAALRGCAQSYRSHTMLGLQCGLGQCT